MSAKNITAKKHQQGQQELPIPIRVVTVENLADLTDLANYREALVVFKCRGCVVGQARLQISDGILSAQTLRSQLASMAFPIWRQLAIADTTQQQIAMSGSVVVCTRDRTKDLANCLPGLNRLAQAGHDVIIVDSCPSNQETAQLVSRYPLIRYVHEVRPGLDIARNTGLLAARHELVAFTDDDAQVDDEWLTNLLKNFDDPMVAVVTGITMPLALETPAQQWFEATNGFGRGFERQIFDASVANPLAAGRIGAGVNMAIRRSFLRQIGMFDEALDGGTPALSGGDQEFFFRVLARGFRIVYDPSALVWHQHRREWDSLRRTIYGYGVGLFAWWTRALLVEKEYMLLITAPRWFISWHLKNLIRSLLKRPDHHPLDLAIAEFKGALFGPVAYLKARRWLKQYQTTSTPLATEVEDTEFIVEKC